MKSNMIKAGLFGSLCLMLSIFALGALLGFMVLNEILEPDSASVILRAFMFFLTYIIAVIVIRKIPQGKMIVSIMLPAGYILVSFVLMWTVWGRGNEGMNWSIFLPVAAAIFAGIMGSRHKKVKR